MPDTADGSTDGRHNLDRLNILLHLALDGLGQFDISKQSAFRFRLEFSVLELLQGLLRDLAILPEGKELQMLEIVVIPLERPEGYAEFDGNVGLQDRRLGKYLKDSHILPVQVLPFLSDPTERQPALHLVGYLNLPLARHRQHLIIPKVNDLTIDVDELVLLGLQEQLLLQHVGVLSDLHVRLIEVLLRLILQAPLGQLQQ